MTKKIKIGLLIITISFLNINCDLGKRFEKEFQLHTKDIDFKLSDKDPLMPNIVFVKNDKPIGFEFTANPEQGTFSKRTFINEKGEIEKIIIRKNYFMNIKNPFDSIYVIEPIENKIMVYTDKNNEGFKIENPKLMRDAIFDVEQEYNKILRVNNSEETK